MNNLVTITDQKAMTTSRIVSQAFDKQHKDVLRAISNLECSEEFTERNFAPSAYKDSTGRMLPMYHITRDGFTFLAMGFTGKRAAEFKERFIAEFNRMEQALREGAGERKQVDVNHSHQRGITNPNGLDIKYTLDLTKLCMNPSRDSIKLLARLTGLDLDDIADELQQGQPAGGVSAGVARFVRERLQADPGGWVEIDALYQNYCDFCEARDASALSRQAFCSELRQIVPDLKRSRSSLGHRPWGYGGISLMPIEQNLKERG